MRFSNLSFTAIPFLTAAFLTPFVSTACPMCHSSAGEAVRAGIIETASSGVAIQAVALPFLILALLVSAFQLDGDTWIKRARQTPRRPS